MYVTMRYLIAAAVLAAASPAAAQHPQGQLQDLRMQAEAAQNRAIDQQNQLMSLEARLRADQATANLRQSAPGVPQLRYDPTVRGTASAGAPSYPAIPDSALADSNRRIQAAARNRR